MTRKNTIRETLAQGEDVVDDVASAPSPAPEQDNDDERAFTEDPDVEAAVEGLNQLELERIERAAAYDQNDRDNARRLDLHNGDAMLYVAGMGWLLYTGTHWKRDEGDLGVRLMGQNLVDWIKREIYFIQPSPAQARLIAAAENIATRAAETWSVADKRLLDLAGQLRGQLGKRRSSRKSFAVSSGNSGRTEAMLKQAASHKAISPDALDADKMLFNLENGTLRFSRIEDPESDPDDPRLIGHCELVPHAREHRITKRAAVQFHDTAACPGFLAFLERVQPEAEMREFLQVAHGFALLIGGNAIQRLIFHYGSGANGKSVFIETIGRLADSYRAVVDPATIAGDGQRDAAKANNDIARLHSARLVTVEELPRDTPLKENLIKALTGGTRQVARFLNKELFEFDPEFVAIMSGNDMPTVSGTDYGIWRRLLIVEWGVTIPEGERREFDAILRDFDAERPGILNWLIEGAVKYLTHGFTAFVPRKVTEFTDDYREERDPVGTFAAACIIRREGTNLSAGDLYEAYKRWCEAGSVKPYQQTAFGRRLNALGYKKQRGARILYLDVILGNVPDKFDPREPSGSDTRPEPPPHEGPIR